uniref:FAS1 domain-containing protein n=1 Tax=Salix viminalis TaxID=40686 RepID=A0A6N2KNC9_SALVM
MVCESPGKGVYCARRRCITPSAPYLRPKDRSLHLLSPESYCHGNLHDLASASHESTRLCDQSNGIPSKSQDLVVATNEMARANYFSFVMLINMSPLDQRLQENDASKRCFWVFAPPLNPSPLLFDHLQHIPPGSLIPSSDPDYMLNISNKGRKNFSLNNVRITSPNLCTAGSSIRCHGIDGVLFVATDRPHLPASSNSSSPAVAPPLPLSDIPPSFPSPAPAGAAAPTDQEHSPKHGAAAPTDQEHSPKHSGSSHLESPSPGGAAGRVTTVIAYFRSGLVCVVLWRKISISRLRGCAAVSSSSWCDACNQQMVGDKTVGC